MPEKELESNIRKISASARQSTAEECCARCCAVERERLVCMICMSAAQRGNICVLQRKVVLGRSRDAEIHARGACEAGQEQTGRRWTTAIGERTGEGESHRAWEDQDVLCCVWRPTMCLCGILPGVRSHCSSSTTPFSFGPRRRPRQSRPSLLFLAGPSLLEFPLTSARFRHQKVSHFGAQAFLPRPSWINTQITKQWLLLSPSPSRRTPTIMTRSWAPVPSRARMARLTLRPTHDASWAPLLLSAQGPSEVASTLVYLPGNFSDH